VKQANRPSVAQRESDVTVEGFVVRTEAGFHRVLSGDRIIVCRVTKRMLGGQRVATTAVVIGDRVRVRQVKDDTGVIEEVLPRDNELVRGAAGGSRYLDVIAANLDLLIVVHSLREPEFNYARVDRFLLLAEAAEIPALLCLNKLDLVDEAITQETRSPYELAGYPVLLTGARSGMGIDQLQAHVSGRITALVGPSGVGKSSLLNAMQPGLRLLTAEISESTGKGRHTTTTAELLHLNIGGWIADTPGLRELSIRDVSPEELEWLFPEFRPFLGTCRFTNCSHRTEIGCAILAAVDRGDIAWVRHRSYLRVYEDLEAGRPF